MNTAHLRREERRAQLVKVLARLPGATVIELSHRIGMSRNATAELMREMQRDGKVKAEVWDHTNHWSLV